MTSEVRDSDIATNQSVEHSSSPKETMPSDSPDVASNVKPGQSSTTLLPQYINENSERIGNTATKEEELRPKLPPAGEVTGWKRRVRLWIKHNYSLQPGLDLVLPTPPTDAEKIYYLHSRRAFLFATGIFSLLSLAAGMWLFVQAAPAFYWFGLVARFLQFYLILSYIIGLFGRDFDIKGHEESIREYPLVDGDTCPSVDIFLPCCKEPLEILLNTYKYVRQLDCPARKLKVHVLDDGDVNEVKKAAESFGFAYISRDDKPRLRKAGNLRWAFARTEGDLFVILDADFCPRFDFLKETIPEMLRHSDTAIVQTPQFFRTSSDQSWVEQGAAGMQELFYRFVQVNRNRWGAAICVGSCALYRREALKEVGGTAEIGFSEDVHTGFFAMSKGWKVRYMPINLALGMCPDNPTAFFSQQNRWCMGSTTLLSNKEFWSAPLTWIQKLCFLSGMMYYTATALSPFINPLPAILLVWAAPKHLLWYNLFFVVPSLINSTLVYSLWAKSKHTAPIGQAKLIQSYSHLDALKDKILGTAMQWVPTGDAKAHKSNKYRNMRMLCIAWTITFETVFIVGAAIRGAEGVIDWYNFMPLIAINLLYLWTAQKFILCS